MLSGLCQRNAYDPMPIGLFSQDQSIPTQPPTSASAPNSHSDAMTKAAVSSALSAFTAMCCLPNQAIALS